MRIIRGFLLCFALLLAPRLAASAYTCTATYTCSTTQYWTGSACATCPAGYKCAGATINVVDGVMPAESGRTACSAAGEYQDAEGQTGCKSVGAGNYKVDNLSRAACDANYFCTGDGYRQACPTEYPNAAAGTASIAATACYKNESFSDLAQTYCSAGVKKTNVASLSGGTQSTSGYTKTWTAQPTATAGTTAATTAFKAKAGSYVSSTFVCSQCTGASFTDSENTLGACTACPAQTDGWTRNGGTGWASATSCNQTKTGNAINQYCSAGVLRQNATNATTWGASIVDTAISAAAGSYVSGQTCVQCAAGTFTATAGTQTSCGVCPDDTYVATPGNTSCSACLANYHTTGTTAANHDNANDCAITCAAGTYLLTANNTTCSVCPTGKYQTTPTTIAQGSANTCAGTCPATYDYNPGTTAEAHDEQTDCQTECQPGNYIATANAQCSAIPAIGYRSTAQATNYGSAGSYTNCPDEYQYDSSTGKTQITQCTTRCIEGLYVGTATDACEEIPLDGYRGAAQVTNYGSLGSYTNCPESYRGGNIYGKVVQSQCQADCAAGTRVVSANDACTTPEGSWWTDFHYISYGQISPYNNCIANYATASTALAAYHDNLDDCKQSCPGGQYLASTTGYCVNVGAGYFSLASTASQSTATDGDYLPRTLCTPGSYSNIDAGAQCLACGGGLTTSAAGMTGCDTLCPNSANAQSWLGTSWQNTNAVNNLCSVASCAAGYSISGGSCVADTYAISYEINGGTIAGGANPDTYTVVNLIQLQNPTKTGATFAGWCDDAGLTTNCTTTKQITHGSTGNRSFYAAWTTNAYTITFQGNGSTGGNLPSQINCTYGVDCLLPGRGTATRDGYTWTGWCTDTAGAGTCGAAGDAVQSLSADAGATIIMYAIWSGCGAATYADGASNSCVACAGGTYSTGGANASCSTCEPGFYCSAGVKAACSGANQWQAAYGESSCDSVADGYVKSHDYALATCGAGNYCKNGVRTACPAAGSGQTGSSPTTATATASDVSECMLPAVDCQDGTASGEMLCMWQTGTGQYCDGTETCVLDSCANGYHMFNGNCETNAQSCTAAEVGLVGANISGNATFVLANNAWNRTECLATGLPHTGADVHGSGTKTCNYTSGTGTIGSSAVFNSGCTAFAITACDAGYYLYAAADENCAPTNANYYSAANDTTQTACPNGGITAAGGNADTTACYLTNIAYSGTNCQGTQKCFHDGTNYAANCEPFSITTCDAGYYYLSGAPNGTPAPVGSYSTDGPVDALPCPDGGLTDATGSTAVNQCFKTCGSPALPAHAATITAVDAKEYFVGAAASGNYAQCRYSITCNAGYTPANNSSPTPECVQSLITVHFDGNGGATGAMGDIECAYGNVCNAPDNNFKRAGYVFKQWCTNADGSGTCITANGNAGGIATGGTITLFAQWTACNNGKYSDENNSAGLTCQSAPIGTYVANDGAAHAGYDLCDAGYYQPQTGQNTCSATANECPEGTYNTGTGNWTCNYCPFGTYNPGRAQTGCLNAGLGKRTTNCLDQDVWEGCSANADCETGTYSSITTAGLSCALCEIGSYAGTTGKTSCDACPAGTVAAIPGLAICVSCNDADKYQDETGQSVCKSVPAGTYKTSAAAIANCPLGQYCPGDGAAYNCAAGTIAAIPGLTQCEACSDPAKYQPLGGQSACDDVPAGSYKTGNFSIATCPAGKYCPGDGGAYECPAGSVSGTTGLAACDTCSANDKYMDELSGTGCKSVPAGYYKVNSSSIAPCAAGNYCPGDGLPYQCEAGMIAATTGLSACSACVAPNEYQNDTGASACKIIPAGSYKADNSTAVLCPIGSYCTGNGASALCPTGTAAPTMGLDVCAACGAQDKYQPALGAGACDDIPAGYYKVSNSTDNLCRAGRFCPGDGIEYNCAADDEYQDAAGQFACKYTQMGEYKISNSAMGVCPAGEKCPGDGSRIACASPDEYQDLTGQAECKPVPAGWHKISNSEIVGCTAGYYCPSDGSENICPAGKFCPTGSAELNSIANCAAGYYCPEGSTSSHGEPVIADPGCGLSTNKGECPCAAGYYCEAGADVADKTICPVGYFCVGGSPLPTLCPAHSACNGAGMDEVICAVGFELTIQPNGARVCGFRDEPCSVAHGSGQRNVENGTCAITACETGYHISPDGARCEADLAECGTANGRGHKMWLGGGWGYCAEEQCNVGFGLKGGDECLACDIDGAAAYRPRTDGDCVVMACEIGRHLEGNLCALNTRDCTLDGGAAGEQIWDGGTWGACRPTDCADGYHIENGVCAADERPCAVANGTGVQHYDNGKWSACEAESCAAGYTSQRGLTNDWTQPCGRCRNSAGAYQYSSAVGDDDCTINFCENQGEQYALIDNECVLICVEGRQDETSNGLHWNSSSKKCEPQCKSGYEAW